MEDRLTSRTTMLLQGTSQYLDRVQRDICQTSVPSLPSDIPQTPGSQSSRSTRRFGLAPWHRRGSHESILSVSSSVFKLLLGKAPAATPNSDYQYEGTDGRAYTKGMPSPKNVLIFPTILTHSCSVDITSPDPVDPTFLPSVSSHRHCID